MPYLPRTALAASMIAGLLLTGCSERPTRPVTTTPSATAAPAARVAPSSRSRPTAPRQTPAASSSATLPDQTGIAACDDYLSSYLACHRAAHIFAPDQLQSRYEAMRTNLLHDSQDPDIRPLLAERCNSLARSLRQALHGKSCATEPEPAPSSP